MVRIFLVLVLSSWTVSASAKSCLHLFEPNAHLHTIQPFMGFAKSTDGISQDALFVQIRPNKKTNKSLTLIYGNYAIRGYVQKSLTLQSRETDAQGNVIWTYSLKHNGMDLVVLTVSQNASNPKAPIYKLTLKSEVTTPSSSERVYQFVTGETL